MKKLSVLVIFLGLGVVSGCTPSANPRAVTHTSMGSLDKGMSPDQAQKASGAIAKPVFHFELNGQQWSAHYYLHYSGDAVSRYMALYDESGLRYWGFLHEFERQRDEQITAASRQAEVLFSGWIKPILKAQEEEDSGQW